MKSVLISIRPKWCHKIFTGEKTIELRKTAPKPPFRVVVYCTKASIKRQTVCGSMVLNSDELYRLPDGTLKYGDSVELMVYDGDKYSADNFLNGKVIGEFICDRVHNIYEPYLTWLEEQSCVDMNEIATYKGDKDCIYGLHITAPKLYDKPIMLAQRPPQSWCYVEEIRK